MGLSYPLVNGTFYEFADISFMAPLGANLNLEMKSISYKNSKKRGKVYGTHPEMLGTTRGKSEPEASFEMQKAAYDDFLTLLSLAGTLGYMEVSFPITVVYGNPSLGQRLVTDKIYVNGIEEDDDSHSEGIDGLTVKVSMSVTRITRNGKTILGPVNSLPGLPII